VRLGIGRLDGRLDTDGQASDGQASDGQASDGQASDDRIGRPHRTTASDDRIVLSHLMLDRPPADA
jgi:hypothetical protein